MKHDGICDHWMFIEDRRCSRRARFTIVLGKRTVVRGVAMSGTYPRGVWRFCGIHYNLFQKGRQ